MVLVEQVRAERDPVAACQGTDPGGGGPRGAGDRELEADRVLVGAGGPGGGMPDPKTMFDAQDKNKDGVITKDEASRPEFFDGMDGDKDGKVTLEEMQKAIERFSSGLGNSGTNDGIRSTGH